MKNYYNIIETLVGILCADDGKVKILLKKKHTEPYKGHWILPGGILENSETLEQNVSKVIFSSTGIRNMEAVQCHTFSTLNRDPDERIIASCFISFTTKEMSELYFTDGEYSWFDLKKLPKLGYDHNEILRVVYKKVRRSIIKGDMVYKFFPSDFTIPELQKFFEGVLEKSLDRRNFRKKLIMQDVIEETGFKTMGSTGRPGNLYRFKEKWRGDF